MRNALGTIKMISEILSFLCILALCLGVFVKFDGIVSGISLGYFNSDWVFLCISGPIVLLAVIALFFELGNFKSRYFPKGMWIVLVGLDVFIYCAFFWYSNVSSFGNDKTAIVASATSKTECYWDANMDVILEIYTCQMDSNCKHMFKHRFKDMDDFNNAISQEQRECLLDSLAKTPTSH